MLWCLGRRSWKSGSVKVWNGDEVEYITRQCIFRETVLSKNLPLIVESNVEF